MVGIVICPMIFYIPKFFELRTVYVSVPIMNVTVDCAVFGLVRSEFEIACITLAALKLRTRLELRNEYVVKLSPTSLRVLQN